MHRAWNDRIRQRRSFFLRRIRAIKVGCATRDSLPEFHIHREFDIQRSCERRVATVGCNRDSKARYDVLTSQVADMAYPTLPGGQLRQGTGAKVGLNQSRPASDQDKTQFRGGL